MANGESNHPEPLDGHEDHGEEENGGDEEMTLAADQDELELELDEDAQHEYAVLEQTIAQLDSCLDQMEQKNDDLNAKLRALLAASREDYEQISAAKMTMGDQDQNARS